MLYGMSPNSEEREISISGLNPYFVGKCSTAAGSKNLKKSIMSCLNPYFVGKCSTAPNIGFCIGVKLVLILILLENALRLARAIERNRRLDGS